MYICIYKYVYIYIYICVHICTCACLLFDKIYCFSVWKWPRQDVAPTHSKHACKLLTIVSKMRYEPWHRVVFVITRCICVKFEYLHSSIPLEVWGSRYKALCSLQGVVFVTTRCMCVEF